MKSWAIDLIKGERYIESPIVIFWKHLTASILDLSGVFIVYFEQVPNIVLVFLLLNLNK